MKKTYFVTANLEIVYECFADSKEEAEKKMDEALDSTDERIHILENGMVQILKVEEADEHFKNHD